MVYVIWLVVFALYMFDLAAYVRSGSKDDVEFAFRLYWGEIGDDPIAPKHRVLVVYPFVLCLLTLVVVSEWLRG